MFDLAYRGEDEEGRSFRGQIHGGSVEELGAEMAERVHWVKSGRLRGLWFYPLRKGGRLAALRYRDQLPEELRRKVPTEPDEGQLTVDPTCTRRTWHHAGSWCETCEGWG